MPQITAVQASGEYQIHIGSGLLGSIDLLSQYCANKKIAIITQTAIAEPYLEHLKKNLVNADLVHTYITADGEAAKSLAEFGKIIDFLAANKFHRDSLLVGLGGGVICDLVGFVAASYQRGIAHILLPTSLLAQVDAAIGAKTGINHPLQKNLIGAIWPPKAVISDLGTLATLPNDDYLAGMAEVIKYALIFDLELLDYLERHHQAILNRDNDKLTYLVACCSQHKAKIVAEDEREAKQLRYLLNFGHTFGHALEVLSSYHILHGFAVAQGMRIAAELSCALGQISVADLNRIKAVIKLFGLPYKVEPQYSPEAILQAMSLDKKIEGQQLKLILLDKLAQASVHQNIAADQIINAIRAAAKD